ncbi:hypothetical protein A3F66_03445 [candidate division TM6 bacterium RIFCSPHIGHO2_12_FULL_32_22]|nr:MAG: hypothetical protein A3F66_03445 [candidate division TM6 bacterium RIFCSPHIGHO2_12_FULL_32_22]
MNKFKFLPLSILVFSLNAQDIDPQALEDFHSVSRRESQSSPEISDPEIVCAASFVSRKRKVDDLAEIIVEVDDSSRGLLQIANKLMIEACKDVSDINFDQLERAKKILLLNQDSSDKEVKYWSCYALASISTIRKEYQETKEYLDKIGLDVTADLSDKKAYLQRALRFLKHKN